MRVVVLFAVVFLASCGGAQGFEGARYKSGSWSVEPTKVKVPGDRGYGVKITRRY